MQSELLDQIIGRAIAYGRAAERHDQACEQMHHELAELQTVVHIAELQEATQAGEVH